MFGTGKPKLVSFSRLDQNDEQQNAAKDEALLDAKKAKDVDENKYKKEENKLNTWHALVIGSWCLCVFFLVVYMDQRLPDPLTLRDTTTNPDRFIEERARKTLRALTSVGARPAGSYENEVLAVDLIVRELNSIKLRAQPIHKLSIDIQKPRGSFNLKFVDGLTHSYRNIQNVIAKVESGLGSKHSLLVNCHFDSVPQSPGASDDAVSCAIMLEILEVLTQSSTPLRHNLVFLFNGAEENMLPAAHGFITQHIWAEDIRAFINLESCGSGGRELVFQTGPGHPWLVEAYADVAPHPFASVIGQELFQTGVIPADTDFRIFRDYGNIPGLDIAYMKNGYVYHTVYDTEENIPAGSIQRAGDNLLAVVGHIAQSDILADTSSHSEGGVVFFDFLGLFLIHYPEWVGMLLNLTVVGYALFRSWDKAKNSYRSGVTTGVYTRQLAYTFAMQICGCVASFIVVTFIATIIDIFSKTMSWYSRPWLIFFLYMVPTICTVIAVLYFALPRQKKYFQFSDGAWVIESLYFEVSKLIWAFFTLLMTVARLKSSFFCMVWVLFPSIGRSILENIYDKTPAKRKPRDLTWLVIHLLSLLIPLILNMYLILTTFSMFIPIMSRSGSALNPDLIIGYKAAGMTLATLSFLCPLSMVMNKPTNVITTLYLTTFITVIAVIVTPLGFPYSASESSYSPHRALVIHTDREFYNRDGTLHKADSGYFMVNLDRNSPAILKGWLPELSTSKEISSKDCENACIVLQCIDVPSTTSYRNT
ncbi:endoplasmic reticulum metallopeptidase 1 isoform X2 [Eurytemora carolleeae]|uniref:endoplasmic reticulum metallopeptidase 1 isoform X2 n=1 Tax=Eurytemora carolleeae TaxID=1294199 RepID=UPI000C77CCF6|nr:endoplasmic reticulum metallopeptidase 1 isoform X2 [Eurytemora carolleeae]|eukprot:XP_023345863.1 endoplasmic reticulum metallopeptidase 1-like isoform X2 [Eurytemora affinis]